MLQLASFLYFAVHSLQPVAMLFNIFLWTKINQSVTASISRQCYFLCCLVLLWMAASLCILFYFSGNQKKGHNSLGDQQSYYLETFIVFGDFTNHRKKTNRMVIFSSRPFPNILKYWDHQCDFPSIWKTRLFQTHIEEFS